MKTKQKGVLGEQLVLLDLLKKGYIVSKPVNEDSPYDLLVDTKEELLRIQVKFRNNWHVPSKRNWSDKNGSHVKYYLKHEVDVFALCDEKLDVICYVPFSLAGIYLLDEASNTTWRYLKKDFTSFPPKQENYKKLLSNGKEISEQAKYIAITMLSSGKSIMETSNDLGVPYHTVRKWKERNL